ncbi:hypothetical protein BD779DRAFT_1675628 [Infundibulicybe gibba]|nr:hypothetical protein BD779DRAFT_1675628 [Infundibulicybe gibba]
MDLPPEIIEIIFLQFCSSKTIFPLEQDEPRLLVTQICSRWRAIALDLPSLWANIRISLGLAPLLLDPIHAWISRSAQSTLSFGIRIPDHFPMTSTAIIDPVLQYCTSLKLHVDEPTLIRLLSLPPASLQALQKISIMHVPTQRVITSNMILRVTAFQQCLQLRRAKLTFPAHTIDLADLHLPWHQLTHLDAYLCSLREHECLNVLRQCTALEECSISTFYTPSHDPQRMQAFSRHPIVLPFLHTLRLGLGSLVNRSTRFVHALRLPHLRSLCVETPASSPHALLPVLRVLLSETILHLDFPSWTPTDLASALVLVPNLETLKLRDSNLGLLQTLGRGAAPRLMALRLGVAYPRDLFDMLEARVAAARSDSSIAVLSDVSAVSSDVWDIVGSRTRLTALRAVGVQVVFRGWSR